MEFKNIASADPSTCISNKVMKISRLTANIFRRYLGPFEITNSQMTLLFILSKQKGLTQKQLSDMIHMEKSSINRNLKRLVDRNYLTKENFPIIAITPEGKIQLEMIIPQWNKAMAEIRGLLDNEGESAIDTVLQKLQNNK